MVSAPNLKHDFDQGLTEDPLFSFLTAILPEALPHEPPSDWEMAKRWVHFHWTDDLIPPTVGVSNDTVFAPFHFSTLDIKGTRNLSESILTEGTLQEMVLARTQFVLEDYCHIPREKGYWFRLGEVGFTANEYYISSNNESDIFIPVCVCHFAFGLRFPLHPFFSSLLCYY